jgi:hypothetical protein
MAVDAVVLLVHAGKGRGRRGDREIDGVHAHALHTVVSGFAPDRLLCLPGMRGSPTLTRLAGRLGLPLTGEPVLTERRTGRPAGDLRRVRRLAAAGGTAAVAAPGPVIRGVITALARKDRVALPRIRAEMGSVWALFFRGVRLASADYYEGWAR